MLKKRNNPLEYLTTEEAIEEFPFPAKFYEWTTHKLKTASQLGYIEYKYDNNIKRFVFRRGSIVDSIRYILKKNGDQNNDLRDSLE